LITDGSGMPIEHRDVLIQFVGEFPRLSGTLKWDGPGSMVANFNANYSRAYEDLFIPEHRDLVFGVDRLRDLHNRTRGYGYEIGGDVDFAFGAGRLKLIGLESFDTRDFRSDSILVYADGAPSTGSRFAQVSDSGETIGRAEYRWDMLGGSWQLDAEAAFNRLDQAGQLFTLDTAGGFVEIPFPGGTGGVIEDRYELILNHNRTLAPGLTVQLSAGGEYSKLVQSGPGGLSRSFWRPKGSATLAWTPETGLDLSLKVSRTVGQLAFGDFLANVNLGQNTGNAGNALLVPQQAWEAEFEARKNLAAWGSATLRLYGQWIEDYIDIIPVAGGFESRGNIVGGATLYGASLNATINLDPLGWKGAKITANGRIEDSTLPDPLTGIDRPFSDHNYTGGEVTLRYDIPDSDWAIGGGLNWDINRPYVRLFEVGRGYEGPYTFAFIENKDVFGLTVNLNMFNLTAGQDHFDRTIYTGLRDRSPISTIERRRSDISTIYRLTVRGSF
jgi:hypothetical protein